MRVPKPTDDFLVTFCCQNHESWNLEIRFCDLIGIWVLLFEIFCKKMQMFIRKTKEGKMIIFQTSTIVTKRICRLIRVYFASLLFIALNVPGGAQHYYFHNYTGNDGLSQLVAQAVFQDRDGYIWIGTQAGLNRYDGNQFEIFSIQQGLANDWINAITQDSTGRIWIGTNGGLSSWLPDEGFTNYNIAYGLINTRVYSVVIDAKGGKWCGTNMGLCYWNGPESYTFIEKLGPPETKINTILLDHTNRLWIGTDAGLFYKEGEHFAAFPDKELQSKKIYNLAEDNQQRLWVGLLQEVRVFLGEKLVFEVTQENGLIDSAVNTLMASQDGVLWIGTESGITMFHNEIAQSISSENGLPFYGVRAFLEDREGIIWIGGFGGVAKFIGRAFTNYTKKDGLGANNVRPILRDHNGFLWVGTTNGLSRFDGHTWVNFTTKDGLNNNSIRSLCLDRNNILWIGNDYGLNYLDGDRFFDIPGISQHGRIESIVQDSSGAIWCAVQRVGIFHQQSANEFEHVKVDDQSFLNARLLVDSQGNVWASGDYGLSRWNGKSWKTFTTADGLADNEPYFLSEDYQGNIWFGYHSSRGVTCYNGTSFKTYTTADGLNNDAVYSPGVDQHNNLWIGTARGVDRFDGKNFINYGTSDGYASHESNAGGFFADHDGTLWFATAEGLSHYNPQYDLSFGKPPSIKIQRFFLGDEKITVENNVIVPHNQNDLQAHIASLSYINEKHLSYRYRLSGYNARWKLLKGHEISYTNLPPGSYTLEVQSRKYQHSWSEPVKVSFRIKPPYWRTWWFGLLVILVFVAAVTSLFKYRVYKIQFRNRRLKQTVAERTSELERQKLRLEETLIARERAEEALKLTQFAIDNSSDAAFWMQSDARILYVNDAACKVLGYSSEELLTMTIFDIDTVLPQEYWTAHWQELKQKRSLVMESHYRTREGKIFPVEISANFIEFSGKAYNCVFARDITERKKSENKLQAFTAQLERSNRELLDFAYVASHDLQEPLRKIQAFGDRLKTKFADTLGAQGRDYLERMQNAAERMHNLINDLLTYSRVSSKAKPFVSVNFDKAVREVLSDLEVRIEETGARVEIVDLPIIDADALQVRQLMQNLLGNALKFHRKDQPPVIKIKGDILNSNDQEAGMENSNESLCEISIEDNGIGFDEKYTDRIFGVFQRLHGRGEYEGSGIGLSVCRKIVERHGGRITANSNPGRGTKFTITMPLKQEEENN